MQRETITIRKTKDRFYKVFDGYSKTYRISKKEAEESISLAREQKTLFYEDKDYWAYYN